METVNDRVPEKQIVLCGQGRIGRQLAAKLKALNIQFSLARLDQNKGLIPAIGELPRSLKLLVICIAPGRSQNNEPRWYWDKILSGLNTQLSAGKLIVDNIILVSSTRVYDGIERGIVTAQTPAKGVTQKAKQLIAAEKQLFEFRASVRVLRCGGLYGDAYPTYTPIMLKAADKPRFGIDSIQVVNRLVELTLLVLTGDFLPGIEVLTDGKVYFEGECYDASCHGVAVKQLSLKSKVLISSAHNHSSS
ncbi:hypothetical protein [Aliikangiella coralliicola]|uniref:Uncharacterized protein n=1 Tax=Aliikangiella coralliicola TaxID=2592383 RepID=A0A545UHM1_9GAMM|nr:hypothetical protein [Aliikangiella coralliicola]TQV88962.1 hypothetical protein FLL46_05370 [Aliikangiella coralliicola]